MSKPLTAAQLRALEPRYTVGGLFESGKLGAAEEAALEEIKQIRDSFSRYVNPSRGWMTPRYSDSRPAMPRQMGNGPAWRRYCEWRNRWRRQIVPASPGRPWGMTVADLVVAMAVEPVNFSDFAAMTGMSSLSVVHLFIRSIQDYGREKEKHTRQFWKDWDETDAKMARLKQHRQRMAWAAKKRGQRRRKWKPAADHPWRKDMLLRRFDKKCPPQN